MGSVFHGNDQENLGTEEAMCPEVAAHSRPQATQWLRTFEPGSFWSCALSSPVLWWGRSPLVPLHAETLLRLTRCSQAQEWPCKCRSQVLRTGSCRPRPGPAAPEGTEPSSSVLHVWSSAQPGAAALRSSVRKPPASSVPQCAASTQTSGRGSRSSGSSPSTAATLHRRSGSPLSPSRAHWGSLLQSRLSRRDCRDSSPCCERQAGRLRVGVFLQRAHTTPDSRLHHLR